MPNSLPYDVWLHVAIYLERATLRRLVSVNHAFFDVVLNMEYRDIDLYNMDRMSVRILQRLRDPYISARVRTLRLVPLDILRDRPPAKPRRLISKIKHAASKVGVMNHRKTLAFGTPGSLAKALIASFKNMDGLVAFNLCSWSDEILSRTACDVAFAAWPMFSSRLRVLKLELSVRSIGQLLSPAIIFRNLEDLDIKVTNHHDSSDPGCKWIISSILLPFINNHQPTLVSFSFSDMGSLQLDSSPLLFGMGYFPHLKKISFICVENLKGVEGIWHILGLHAQGLEEIHIKRNNMVKLPLYKGPNLTQNPAFDVALTAPVQEPLGLGYLKFIGCHVTSLRLMCHTYCYADICNIVNALEGHTKIRNISMQLDFVSPQVIDLFATKMPHLHNLRLAVSFYAVVGDESLGIKAQEKAFCMEILKRRYSNWKLQRFELDILGVTSVACDEALFCVLPQIRTQSVRY